MQPTKTQTNQYRVTVSEALRLGVPPIMIEAQNAFLHALPQLLKERRGQWVAYRGSKQLGFGKSKPHLYQEWEQRGFPYEELVVYCVEETDLPFIEDDMAEDCPRS